MQPTTTTRVIERDEVMSAEKTPLEGILVADFSRVLAGPYCTLLLADLGAEVIKIERPGSGDDTRAWGPPFVASDAVYYLGLNRDKKSIALDLNSAEDREVARNITRRADIVVENFTAGIMSRFGLDYESVSRLNPGAIYCSITAYLDRPEIPGYDLLMQASSGFMSITGPVGGPPSKIGVAALDVLAGLHACVGILAALSVRQKTGRGQLVRAGLFESSVASLVNQASNYLIGGVVPHHAGNEHPNIVPYQSFEASDDAFVLAIGNDKLYQSMCDAIGRPDLGRDPRFSTNGSRVTHRVELTAHLDAVFRTETVAHWMDVFSRAKVPAAPVRTLDAVFSSPEGQHTLLTIPDPRRDTELMMVKSPFEISDNPTRRNHQPPPTLGEHTAEIRQRFSGEGS
jgi:crotonobetainyl-CoA:carnitine CoA-transferase CaiB-like acyl-CoA transferase